MEAFSSAGLQMAILFTIMLLGALARKKHFMNDDFDALLSRLVMSFAVPGMILDSVLGSSSLPSAGTVLMVLGYSLVLYLCICAFAYVFVRFVYRGVPKVVRGAHTFVMAFGNTGFIGFGLIAAIMGSDAVLYAAIYNIPYNLCMFSLGMIFVAGEDEADAALSQKQRVIKTLKTVGKQLVTPVNISCFVAIGLAIAGITDSGYVGQTCELLGEMTVPAAMLIIGSTLAKMPIKQMFNDGWSYLSCAMRLIVVPLLVFFVGGLFMHDSYILAIIVIESATPVASVGTMLCLTYKGDASTMARGTFLTTVFSLITLPLIALLVV